MNNATDNAAVDSAPLRERVQGVLNLIRPAVQADGGDVELVDVSPEGVVSVRFMGACIGCPSSSLTLHMGIERMMKERIPAIARVVAV